MVEVQHVIGTLVSGFFLFLLAAINLVILAGIVKVFREMRSGRYNDQQLEVQLNKRGLMKPVPRPAGPPDRRPVEDVPDRVGIGFDTATEVALLVLAGMPTLTGA